MEHFLERHIATNTCPICYELMAGKERQPTLLFPCGHTFCASCIAQHLKQPKQSTCPFCREPITSHAPNVSLQQVIDGFVERQGRVARGEVLDDKTGAADPPTGAAVSGRRTLGCGGGDGGGAGGGGGGGGGSGAQEVERYSSQYRLLTMRCHVLQNQLDEARDESSALHDRRATAGVVLHHLRTEREQAATRLRQVQAELEVVEAQVQEQAAKLEQIEGREAELAQQTQLVERTLAPLLVEKEKAKLLIQSFSPEAAIALG